MIDHVKSTLRDDKPDYILHTRTNDLRSEKTSIQIAKSNIESNIQLKTDGSLMIDIMIIIVLRV